MVHMMILLILGWLLFVGVHLMIGLRSGRQKLENRLGRWGLRAVVGLGSLAGLAMMAQGYAMARFYPGWMPISWGRELGAVLMPVASVLLVAAYLPSNIKRLTAHPMLWAVVLWAVSHLMVRGDWASIVLFGGLGLYALIAMALAWVRGMRRRSGPQPVWADGAAVGGGLALYAGLLISHPVLFGVSVFQ
jgi:uncharacterized membrane protein